jgi:hypothetical protein
MLLRLIPTEITKYWQIIEAATKESMTKELIDTQEKSNNILRALLIGKLTCWFWKEETKIKGVMITSLQKDDILLRNNLLIYSVYTKISQAKDWIEGFEAILKYARGNSCCKVIFYTKNEKFIRIAKHLGMTETYKMCEIDI